MTITNEHEFCDHGNGYCTEEQVTAEEYAKAREMIRERQAAISDFR